MSPPGTPIALNYFNYFSEIEGYFWKKRGAHLLVSPLDWAIMESWQKAEIPLAAVLKGIDRAFESFQRSRRAGSGRSLKSLAYCVDAVLQVADELQETAAGTGPQAKPAAREAQETFSREELRSYVRRNIEKLDCVAVKCSNRQPTLAPAVREVSANLSETLTLLDSPGGLDLEDLERRFTSLEEKLLAAATMYASEDILLGIRREMDRQLSPYRRKMTSAQLAQVERQYIHKRLFEEFGLPRLSLFYML
ncbi:MAG TPA: hypothetical protein VOA41_02150 [Candidatus Dormibacteraeota bacterium]|nr:hypothetical protein [Candidatus Dormibacteraeota bacterium]